MSTLRKLVVPAVVLGAVLIVLAILDIAVPAHSLPSFYPGHASASSPEANSHHVSHGIQALVGAAVCFAFAYWVPRRARGRAAGY